MDYKKKYEGLMKNIEHLHKSVNPEWKRIIECYIPELKESEDEKIRKNLRDFLLDAPSQDIVSHYLDLEKTLNWLEKQGEQKFSSLSEKEIVCLKRILDFLRKDHNSYTGEDFTNEIVVLEWLITHPVLIHSSELQQNQGAQNPAWSEEDEKKSQLFLAICDDTKGDSATYSTMYREIEELETWLKSIKERMKGE